MIDAAIDHVRQRLAAAQAQVFANSIKDHDGVVHRIADQRQNGRNHRQADLLACEGEETHRDQCVVEAGHHRRYAVDQLKAEPEIDQHAQHRVKRCKQSLLLQLLAHRGAHHLHIAHGQGVVVVRLQGIHDLGAAHIERTLIVLLRQADKDLVIGCLTVALDAGIVDARRIHGLANQIRIRSLLKLHLNLRAALEVHAEGNRAADLRPMHTHRDDAGHAEDQ